MVKFIRNLWKVHTPLFDKSFHLLQLEEHRDWDNDWDTGDFTILAHCFFTKKTISDSFDRDTNLQYEDEFCGFRTRYETSPDPNPSPGISTEDEIVAPVPTQALPPAHTAGITADTVLPPVYKATTPASIPAPTATLATTDDVT